MLLEERRMSISSSSSTIRDSQGSPINDYEEVTSGDGSCLDPICPSFCAEVSAKDFDAARPQPHKITSIARELLVAINHYAATTHFKFASRELQFTHFSMCHYQAQYPYKRNPELFEIIIDLSTICDENTKNIVLNSFSTDDSFVIEIQGENTTKKATPTECSMITPTFYDHRMRVSYQSFALPESQGKVSFTLNLPSSIKINKKIAAEIIKYNGKPYLVAHAPLCVETPTVRYVDFSEQLIKMGPRRA